MSRIHEALKKAEQDRAAQQSSGATDSLFAPAQVISAAVEAAPVQKSPVETTFDVMAGTAVMPTPSTSHVRFDEIRARCAKPKWHPDPSMNVFFDSDPATQGAEQFRTLRSRLYQLRGNQPLRTILITSSIPGEGKTFVSNNLAQAIVRQPDRRALIIDADLRRPRLHLPLGAPLSPGLTDYLRGEVDEFAVIQNGQDSNLCFIPGGNEATNPSELLSNGRLKLLLDRMTPVFDWVILDSPPCLPVADASVLGDMCDGVLLIVRSGSTPSEVAQKACQELQGKNIVGVVLNAVEKSHLYESYYYESYGNGYGERGGRETQK
jgi:capsular exopolysaccharide synthesis family protein